MKDLLCSAFCGALNVRQVPLGYAIKTPYDNGEGDHLLLYVVRNGKSAEEWRIEDDGTQVPTLEASGFRISGTRAEVFNRLLADFGAIFDPETRVIHTDYVSRENVGAAGLRFMGLLLRLQELVILEPGNVRSTWRQDALAAIHQQFDEKITVMESAPVSADLPNYLADVVLSADNVPPLAVYLGTSDDKALQALVLKMETEAYRHLDVRVVLLLERAKENPLKESTYSLAQSRLDSVLAFRGAEMDAMAKIERVLSSGTETLQ